MVEKRGFEGSIRFEGRCPVSTHSQLQRFLMLSLHIVCNQIFLKQGLAYFFCHVLKLC
ncbi:BnaC09g18240D [Brassica napus]|uniref:BnaC09g18240D protein n=2 Tax=Brassica TaxID=3705 RepID=A0A078GWY0_BRANA|nr:BnaC09g18240D [Brassica napus]